MGGKGGGTRRAETPDVSYQDRAGEANQAAIEAMQRQMAEQQQAFQDELIRMREEAERLREEAEERAATMRRESAYDDIEMLFSTRMEAEETAISSVDKEITDEEALADLRGVDYEITEEQRMARIQERFEEFWDVRYEKELSGLMADYGGPELTSEERLLIEQGEKAYYWAPETKYTGFEYPAAPEFEKGVMGPGADDAMERGVMGPGVKGKREIPAPIPKKTGKKELSRSELQQAQKVQQRLLGGASIPESQSLLSRAGAMADELLGR